MRTSRTLGIVLSAAIIALLTLSATAYKTQKGYVKTRGRQPVNEPYKKGRYISNVVIEILDGKAPRSTRSIKDGSFSFTLSGNSFSITKVSAQKYVLADYDILGKVRRYSENPFEITVDLPSSTVDDFRNNQTNMMAKLRKEVEQLRKKYDNLLKQNKITEKEFYELQKQLIDYEQKNGKFILDLAEKYSKLDFDKIDEDQRKFIAFIQNGEYEKADSLLKTQKSVDEWEKELSSIESNIKTIDEEIDRLQETKKEGLKNREIPLEQIDNLCINNFNLCALKLENDSAAYWLERRSNADTTNIQWQLDAGKFICEYISDYDKALRYFHSALNHSLKAEEEQSAYTALTYNHIGIVLYHQSDYKDALDYHLNALDIWNKLKEQNKIAMSLILIAQIQIAQGEYQEAYLTLQNASEYIEDNTLIAAECLHTLGDLCNSTDRPEEAISYLEQSIRIRTKLLDSNNALLATCYASLGDAYDIKNDVDNALIFYTKSLDQFNKTVGEYHPAKAKLYGYIGDLNVSKQEYDQAIKNFNESIRITSHLFGENEDVLLCTNIISDIYYKTKEYSKALKFQNKSLEIAKKIYNEDDIEFVDMYCRTAQTLLKLNDSNNALNLYQKALELLEYNAITEGELFDSISNEIKKLQNQE